MADVTAKWCNGCAAPVPLSMIHPNATFSDGLSNLCESCFKKSKGKVRTSRPGIPDPPPTPDAWVCPKCGYAKKVALGTEYRKCWKCLLEVTSYGPGDEHLQWPIGHTHTAEWRTKENVTKVFELDGEGEPMSEHAGLDFNVEAPKW